MSDDKKSEYLLTFGTALEETQKEREASNPSFLQGASWGEAFMGFISWIGKIFTWLFSGMQGGFPGLFESVAEQASTSVQESVIKKVREQHPEIDDATLKNMQRATHDIVMAKARDDKTVTMDKVLEKHHLVDPAPAAAPATPPATEPPAAASQPTPAIQPSAPTPAQPAPPANPAPAVQPPAASVKPTQPAAPAKPAQPVEDPKSVALRKELRALVAQEMEKNPVMKDLSPEDKQTMLNAFTDATHKVLKANRSVVDTDKLGQQIVQEALKDPKAKALLIKSTDQYITANKLSWVAYDPKTADEQTKINIIQNGTSLKKGLAGTISGLLKQNRGNLSPLVASNEAAPQEMQVAGTSRVRFSPIDESTLPGEQGSPSRTPQVKNPPTKLNPGGTSLV